MGTLTIGKTKKSNEGKGYSSMLAMPTPVGWGDKIRPAKQTGNMRLEKGELRFEQIPVRLFVDRPNLEPDIEDTAIERMSPNVRRAVLPVMEEQSEDYYLPERNEASYRHFDDEIVDYSHPGDSDTIVAELREQMQTIGFRMLVCAISVLFIGALEILPALGVQLPEMFLPDRAPVIYLLLNLFFMLFCAVMYRNIIFGGFKALFERKPDGDGLIALGSTAAVLQTAAELILCAFKIQPVHRVCAAPMIFAYLINDFGLLMMIRRVARNFRFVAIHGVRRAVKMVADDMKFDEILHANKRNHGNVAYTVRTKFLDKYLYYSYDTDFCEQMTAKLAPYVLPLALAAGVIGGFFSYKTTGVWGGVYCMTAAMIAGVPVCRLLCLNLPLARASKQLIPKGVMLNGWNAADIFGQTNALTVNSDSLFPEGTVRLLSVRAFGEAPIDRSVLYAASVVLASGGPLAQVFRALLEEKAEDVLPVDGIGYENEMGVTGWVDDKPVLVGNRRLLEQHGVEIPSKDYEQLMKNGRNRSLVYIAISGRPCAAMLVQYRADPQTLESIRNMVSYGVGLIIYTTDANVTTELISEIYEIPERHISVLSVRAGSEYDRLTHVIRDRAPAVLCTVGRLSALADGITAAIRLRTLLIFTTIIQMVCYGLCVTMTVVLCCISGSGAVSPAQLMLMQLMCLLASAVSLFRKAL